MLTSGDHIHTERGVPSVHPTALHLIRKLRKGVYRTDAYNKSAN
jgi:hypothetical protein